jgi:hypothetical protein
MAHSNLLGSLGNRQHQCHRRDRPYERMDTRDLSAISEAQRASLMALGAVERNGQLNVHHESRQTDEWLMDLDLRRARQGKCSPEIGRMPF